MADFLSHSNISICIQDCSCVGVNVSGCVTTVMAVKTEKDCNGPIIF